MEKSAALSLFAGWKGMPALYSGTDEKTLAEIREFGYTGVDLFVEGLERSCRRCWPNRGYLWGTKILRCVSMRWNGSVI
ncbi:MAG: hypothetical protein E7A95_30315 [Hungatella hathewayi]|nr:hypothetical protein [Hungatella hathewayi]